MAHQTTLTPGVYYPAVHCGVCGVCGAAEIPQRHYRSAPLSPDPTYENGEVITFSGGGDCGVNIVDAAEYRLSNLFGGDDLMFVNATVSTFSVRIEVRILNTVVVGYTGTRTKLDPCTVARIQDVDWTGKDLQFPMRRTTSY